VFYGIPQSSPVSSLVFNIPSCNMSFVYRWHGGNTHEDLKLSQTHRLVTKANLVHSFSWYVYFLVYLLISTCFGWLNAHHQEKQLYSCDSWYLLFCMDNKCKVSHKYSCFSWWWACSHLKHVKVDKYTKK
jgi:hypothetical protein